jgi:hypothetical protein
VIRFILDPSSPNLGITPINVTTQRVSAGLPSQGTIDIVLPNNGSMNECSHLPAGDYPLIKTPYLYLLISPTPKMCSADWITNTFQYYLVFEIDLNMKFN